MKGPEQSDRLSIRPVYNQSHMNDVTRRLHETDVRQTSRYIYKGPSIDMEDKFPRRRNVTELDTGLIDSERPWIKHTSQLTTQNGE